MLAALGTLASVALPKIISFASKKLMHTNIGKVAAKAIKGADRIGMKIHHVSQHPMYKAIKNDIKQQYGAKLRTDIEN